jgi:pimeloyl-ACP methyl ester carboxylesterase
MPEAGAPFESRIHIGGNTVEYRTYQPDGRNPLVFLHDGLGSMRTWKDLPRDLAAATGRPSVVYSREGHDWSNPHRLPRTPDFMHHEALAALYQFLRELEVADVVFVGHSDGASISLIFSGEHQWASGLVLIAPQVFVEPETITGMEDAVRRFETTDLPQRMAKYHRDPKKTFEAWSGIWLDPAFREWNIEDNLPNTHCPVLLIQALDTSTGPSPNWMLSRWG